ncbi:MAG: hypothetical protein RH917_01580 [Lacipirellulaceae bacterium]
MRLSLAGCFVVCLACIASTSSQAHAQRHRAVVPGTGTKIDYVGDDFEGEGWNFIHNHPKSSREQDDRVRSPRGSATNGRWNEGPERGQPDQIQIVDTPAGGLAGSNKALMLRTLRSGIPGYNSRDVQQDDLIANLPNRLGGSIPVGETPSFVVRVYLPPAEQWENRSGPHFGIRGSTTTMTTEQKSFGLFGSRSETKAEPYWPGMWIHFRSETSRKNEKDSAYIAIRGDHMGRDYRAKEIEQFGWWTFGMSFTPDGSVHYYAKPGIEDLTAADHLDSKYPYSYHARSFRTFFFNSCNYNDGKTWSTPFIIDDPTLYVVNSRRVESIVARKKVAEEKRIAAQKRMEERRAAAKQKAQEKWAAAQARKQQGRTNRK